MEGQLRHLLNGVVVEEPGGWADFTEEIERNFDERIIHLKYSSSLLFIGDGYDTLRRLYEEDYCTEVSYACEQFLQGGWQPICQGTIVLSDIQWNLSKCTADTTITDNTVGARILNNKQVKTFPTATKSKSGVPISGVAPFALEVFDPQAAVGTYLATPRDAWDWKLCMEHMIAFVTDGAVKFRSDWYDALPDDERYCLLNGVQLRTAAVTDRPPEYSLEELWEFAYKADNLMAGVIDDGDIVFRVEPDAFWYGTPGAIVLLHQEDLVQSIDTDLLYAGVKMGSQGAIKNEAIAAAYSLPYVGLRTFSSESYTLEGQCNTNNVLDLELPYVVCTNAIEDAVVNNDDGNDDEVFVIQYDRTTDQAVKSDYLTNAGVPYLYNERFLNLSVIQRWKLPASGVTYYADEDASFRAERTVVGLSYDDTLQGFGANAIGSVQVDARFQFDNDYTSPNFDIGNNWGNGTSPGTPVSQANSRYTAPIQGLYSFEAVMQLDCTDYIRPLDVPFTFLRHVYILPAIIIKQYDSGNTLLNTYTFETAVPGQSWSLGYMQPISATGSFTRSCDAQIYMQAGDYIEVWFRGETWIQPAASAGSRSNTQSPQGPYPVTSSNFPLHYVRYILNAGSYVRTIYVATFGGEVVVGQPEEYYSTRLEYTRYLDNVAWRDLKTNFAQAIQVAHDGVTVRTAYPRLLSRTVATGEVDWECIANRDQPNR
jgi:hypothetical protein